MSALSKNHGFTLIETIIYIGLFGLIFSGIFTSIYPILTGADRLTEDLLASSEKEFMIAKITYLLNASLTTSQAMITEPGLNSTSSVLIIKDSGVEKYRLETGDVNCQIPLICTQKQLILTKDQSEKQPLNNDRITISNLSIHRPPLQVGGLPNYIDISFKENNEQFTAIRLYQHF
jgi:type II secretory pathway pseudopilin PulG